MRKKAKEEGKHWLEQAREDLRWTRLLAEQGGYHLACFLAQQIGEKDLKAYLYSQGQEIVLGRSIERLCAAASEFDREFKEKVKRWAILNAYYVPTRYPKSLPEGIPAHVFTREAAANAVALAEEIVSHVEGKIE